MPDIFQTTDGAGGALYEEARRAGKFVTFGISRLRMATDGGGVTTLVCGFGCPLRCRFCINAQSWHAGTKVAAYTPRELYDALCVDGLYFRATGGGVTFGGGEPLLQWDFLPAFREVCGADWKINMETSLQAPREVVAALVPVVDEWIVDAKDADTGRYKAYTGGDGAVMRENLAFLLGAVDPARVLVRLPLIPGCNTDADVAGSRERFAALGATRFDCFKYRENDAGASLNEHKA